MNPNNIIEVKDVSKSFPGVKALKHVSINFERGKVHGLVGENGAGKSTLIKILTGVYSLDSGVVDYAYQDRVLHIQNPLQARQYGISAAYQDLTVAKELSVGENFFLGKVPRNKLGFVDWNTMYQKASEVLEECHIVGVDPKKPIKSLTVSQQAMATIAKISNENANVVIFDEPTALLPNEDVDKLFEVIRAMVARGTSIIYISHRLEEVMAICDTVTVLKDGAVVDTVPASTLDVDKMVSMMVGRTIEEIYSIEHVTPGEEVLRVENLARGDVFENVSFSLRKGEILGFFGLVGSGRTEIMRCIFGADRRTAGDIYIYGKKAKISCVKDATNAKLGLVPEDRRNHGLALPLSVTANINMADYDSISTLGIVNRKQEEQRSREYIDRLNIKAYSGKQIVRNLSGGNQQKVVISKILAKGGEILIFDEPTIGVDVGAKKEIYLLIEELIQQGKSIILVSSYLPEVMGLCDRMVVMCEGRVSGEITKNKINEIGSEAAEELILKMASQNMGGAEFQ
ncbi:sugar ABC transporter ATP-binding protein [Feifania hominis]|uniref:Sugar ABC transporter ATP-binding protein n=1 Tax=Feifania hominis TaxID=2763660 RepID=A0A926DC42_9FIRM|nr:sugar ABC transporter ATP-binding protein [Feifania hominis]MBC8535363.1 sugar ABC transporter ATP-binding protein [Feifania hominis]